MLIHCKTDEKV